jgi:hypothetical protein
MSVRTQDVVKQASDISESYQGAWPVYSDVSPLEKLCDNPHLFKLPNHDKVMQKVLELAQCGHEYIASRTSGYHLLPHEKTRKPFRFVFTIR